MNEWEEDPDDDWPEDDGESEVVACPNCGADVYEEAEQCPSCGEYIVHGSSLWDGKPLWWVLLGIAGVIAVIVVLSSVL